MYEQQKGDSSMKLFKRSLCLLMTILLVLSMVPASVFATGVSAQKAARPSDNWNVPEVEKVDESKLQTVTVSTFDELKSALKREGDIKVTLEADISKTIKQYVLIGRSFYPKNWPYYEYEERNEKIEFSYNTNYITSMDAEIESPTIQVGAGQKYLNLNGYDITVYDNSFTGERGDTIKRNLITVGEGATLVLDDQTSDPGSILYTCSTYPKKSAVQRDVFRVLKNGKLIVNGGSVEAGSSFKHHYDDAGEVGYLDQSVTEYRNMKE